MKITDDDIRLVIKLISEKLGPDASPLKLQSLTSEAIRQLAIIPDDKPSDVTSAIPGMTGNSRLIINAFGISDGNLDDNIRSFLADKNLTLIALSLIKIEQYTSLIAIVDYSNYQSDKNRLKFELSELCEKIGLKAIIQDNSYYAHS